MEVKAANKPGFYHDGGGLYLQVSRFGSKNWILRFTIAGRTRDMGLGPISDWTLAEARERAKKFRKLVDEKVDPIEHRVAELKAREAAAAAEKDLASQQKTFSQCALSCHGDRSNAWKNPKHKAQWINTLSKYAFPHIGEKNVSAVRAEEVAEVLRPIWLTKQETASRVLQRIRVVLNWASAHRHYPDYDLKMWEELPHLLLVRPKKRSKHLESCPYDLAADFVDKLRTCAASEMLKLCFEFTILTAARSGEARGALKTEISLQSNVWVIPDDRMKMDRAHTVPLSRRAKEILEIALALDPESPYVFPNATSRKPFSDQAFTKVILKDVLKVPYTAHGFRSTFRTWAADETTYPREVCEQALAHDVMDEVEAAYARTTFVEQRRRLMQEWADFLARPDQEPTQALQS